MDQEAYANAMRKVAYLAGCAVREEAPDLVALEGADPEQLLKAASRHTLAAITAVALSSAGIDSPKIREEAARGVWKATQLEADWQLARAGLEEAGIWYCPLKGAVLKDLYPTFGMRQMSDYDILFDATRCEDVRRVMENAGFTTKYFGVGAADVYYKLPVSNFEMHRELFGVGGNPSFVSYYKTVKERLVKDDDNRCGWHMDVNECYLYMVAHAFKHFSGSGTGLRSLLDTYVYLLHYQNQMDWDKIGNKASLLGIADFEQQQRDLALRLFNNAPCGDALLSEDEEFFGYIAESGTYGTLGHRVANGLAKEAGGAGGKLSYLARRVFLPMESVRKGYPFFYRHKVLLPLLPLYRLKTSFSIRHARALGREVGYVWRYGRDAGEGLAQVSGAGHAAGAGLGGDKAPGVGKAPGADKGSGVGKAPGADRGEDS